MYNKEISTEESRIITVMRTVAMLSIVMCHLVSWFPSISFIGQFLNVGVPVFFIISGYLYGQKDIKNTFAWYKKQFIKIVFPIYIYILISVIVLFLLGELGEVEPVKCVFAILQLRGFVDAAIGNVIIGHLWFITFILLCYLITPFLQFLREKIDLGKSMVIVLCLSIVEMPFIILIKPQGFISWLPGIFSYILAYFLGAFWNKNINKKAYILLTSAMVISVITRLLGKHLADTNKIEPVIYDKVIATYTHCVIAFWLFFTVYYALIHFKRLSEIIHPICKVCDTYSYEVYISHYMFITGALSLRTFTSILSINILIFIAVTCICAFILHKTVDIFNKRILYKK